MNSLLVPESMNVMSSNVAKNWNCFRELWINYEIATDLSDKDKKICVATFGKIIDNNCYNN